MTRETQPLVTVIALCYNHERFLGQCLDSIRAQTVQDFELIVTDDCSKDGSADLIEAWLAEHRPDAVFVRHRQNAGVCKTLNEAIKQARGKYISMIATDDVWLPDKIERQLAVMESQPDSVAVVYSDAERMDEYGERMMPDFMAAHRVDFVPPSGRVFRALADANFVPAMATLIRRSAIDAVGGYDERLTFEDYDMWLRLSARYDFAFCPGAVARYRILSTSLIRTVFSSPTPNHSYTLFLINERWLREGGLSDEQRRKWKDKLWHAAYALYLHGDPRGTYCLWRTFLLTRRVRAAVLALAAVAGFDRARLKKLTRGETR